MKKYYALIDNGHGVNTAVKCAPDKSILEYVYNRELAASIYERLDKTDNIQPILITPERNDIPLSERVRRINKYVDKYGASNCIMISIHLNASGNGQWMNATGWEAYTTKGQNISDKLATVLYEEADKVLSQYNIKVRKNFDDGDSDKEANFYIIRNSKCPAVLTENLYMDSHKDNEILLSTYGFNALTAIHVSAIKKWFLFK